MPSLPPFFNGKISGVLTLSVSNISFYKIDVKSSYVEFEWAGSQEKQKLLTSKYSKITYDIRTSYKSFLKYISSCTLKCLVVSYENKKIALAFMKNLLMVVQDNQLVKTLPLMNNNGEAIGTLQLHFKLQTFNDTSFDDDIKFLTQFGIQNEVLNTLNDKEFYFSKMYKHRKNVRPISSSSLKSNKSKEELTSDYLMGKDMAPEEEEEALSTLRIMPSAESIVSAAEKIGVYSPSLTSLHIQGHTKMLTTNRPGVKNIKSVQPNSVKSCAKLNKSELPVQKDDVYLHLSMLSINIYRTIKSLQNYLNSTYIVQCLKDQEPNKSLRFMSRLMDDNVVKFRSTTLSSRLEGCTVTGVTMKVYVRPLSERNPVVLGETKQMLDWIGFSTTFGIPRYIKVPIWNNNKIIGHLSLSYQFSKSPLIQKKYEDNFSEKHVENIDLEKPEKRQFKSTKMSKSLDVEVKKNEDYKDTPPSYQMKDHLYDRLYPESNNDMVESELFLDEWSNKDSATKTTKEKEIQTNFEVRQFNKSVQTVLKTFNVAIQVDSDELEDPLDKTDCCDIQNIFRCTHEFTFHIEKKYNSNFNYVTYQFPECVTSNTGKVFTCCRLFRTFGNTNILHLITLPTTIPLETYFYTNYKKAVIILNLHQNDDSSEKVSLLVSHLIDMASEFKTSHITKNLILNNNLSIREISHNNVHIKIHYKRVYHSFPSPKTLLKKTCLTQKSLKKNSKIIVDLTESDSEDISFNKTYTLCKQNDRLVGVTTESSTQTDLVSVKLSQNCETQTNLIPDKLSQNFENQTDKNKEEQQCIIINDTSTLENKTENSTQTDTIVINESLNNQTDTKIRQENSPIFDKLKNNIFKAKIIIAEGYNLPMIKLYGDTIPSAPTTYVIMQDFRGNILTTASVVQQTHPIWNSEWTVVLPTNKLIEKKWLILELWCKKYRNEYAGHDATRDMRIGFILINLCELQYDLNRAGGLYNVISETGENHGKIKVMIDPIDYTNQQTNVNYGSEPLNKSKNNHNKENNINQQTNNDSVNEMLRRIRIENNFHVETRKPKNCVTKSNEKCCEYIDLTEGSPQKFIETTLKKTIAESCLQNCFPNNDNEFDMGTISSVTSWTSSSDDILCSNNSRIVNEILSNKTKMNRIKQIIRS